MKQATRDLFRKTAHCIQLERRPCQCFPSLSFAGRSRYELAMRFVALTGICMRRGIAPARTRVAAERRFADEIHDHAVWLGLSPTESNGNSAALFRQFLPPSQAPLQSFFRAGHEDYGFLTSRGQTVLPTIAMFDFVAANVRQRATSFAARRRCESELELQPYWWRFSA